MTSANSPDMAQTDTPLPEVWKLRLHVVGQTPRAVTAPANRKRLCEKHPRGRYDIEVVDRLENPTLADAEKVLVGLDLRPKHA